MSIEAFYRNFTSLFISIDSCLEDTRILPALMLIYSGIDIVASLERKRNEGTKSSFTRWVNEYLLRHSSLPCNAIELYSARCGVIHTLTSKSDLSKLGKAKEVFYAWGIAKAEDLREASKRLGGYDHIVLHVSELYEAFKKGVKLYLDDLDKNPARKKKVAEKTGLWFSDLSIKDVEKYLNVTGGKICS